MNFALNYRPKTLDEMYGQEHITAKNAPFRILLEKNSLPHCMFFGPAGTGKTTLAKIVSNSLQMPFFSFDATSLKIEDVRKIFKNYENSLIKPLIFIDEVHRLSRNQQEVLLLPMENHQAIIIGASTENPYHVLSGAIRSRSMLFEFKPLNSRAMENILNFVIQKEDISLEEEARRYLIHSSSNDARAMLNLLEYSCKISKNITLEILKNLRANALKDGVSSKDTHYDLISAFIKSMRGSDENAAIYYLARMIDGGESCDFIARRMVIFASEDIGNANPNALNLATSTLTAVLHIGYPEARIILSQCAIYLASSPKSNSAYRAINSALDFVKNTNKLTVPKHLKKGSNEYLYPHDFNGWVEQKYLSEDLTFYHSKNIGFEKTLNEWLKKIKSI